MVCVTVCVCVIITCQKVENRLGGARKKCLGGKATFRAELLQSVLVARHRHAANSLSCDELYTRMHICCIAYDSKCNAKSALLVDLAPWAFSVAFLKC